MFEDEGAPACTGSAALVFPMNPILAASTAPRESGPSSSLRRPGDATKTGIKPNLEGSLPDRPEPNVADGVHIGYRAIVSAQPDHTEVVEQHVDGAAIEGRYGRAGPAPGCREIGEPVQPGVPEPSDLGAMCRARPGRRRLDRPDDGNRDRAHRRSDDLSRGWRDRRPGTNPAAVWGSASSGGSGMFRALRRRGAESHARRGQSVPRCAEIAAGHGQRIEHAEHIDRTAAARPRIVETSHPATARRSGPSRTCRAPGTPPGRAPADWPPASPARSPGCSRVGGVAVVAAADDVVIALRQAVEGLLGLGRAGAVQGRFARGHSPLVDQRHQARPGRRRQARAAHDLERVARVEVVRVGDPGPGGRVGDQRDVGRGPASPWTGRPAGTPARARTG